MLGRLLMYRINHCRKRFGRRMIPGRKSRVLSFFIHSHLARIADFAGGVPHLLSRVGSCWLTWSVMHDARTPNTCPGIVATPRNGDHKYRTGHFVDLSGQCRTLPFVGLDDHPIWSARCLRSSEGLEAHPCFVILNYRAMIFQPYAGVVRI